MRIGLLSDAHGNNVATQVCVRYLRDETKVDTIWFLGDSVGYMLGVEEVNEILASECSLILNGNHEAMMMQMIPYNPDREPIYQLQTADAMLSAATRERIRHQGATAVQQIDSLTIHCVHGSPNDVWCGYLYPDTDINAFNNLADTIVIAGHTHRPMVRRNSHGTTFINPGSCGMPRDIGHSAACGILDTVEKNISLVRIPFDVEAVMSFHTERGYALHSSVVECLHRHFQDSNGIQRQTFSFLDIA
jgi:putative phosphoesterase